MSSILGAAPERYSISHRRIARTSHNHKLPVCGYSSSAISKTRIEKIPEQPKKRRWTISRGEEKFPGKTNNVCAAAVGKTPVHSLSDVFFIGLTTISLSPNGYFHTFDRLFGLCVLLVHIPRTIVCWLILQAQDRLLWQTTATAGLLQDQWQ